MQNSLVVTYGEINVISMSKNAECTEYYLLQYFLQHVSEEYYLTIIKSLPTQRMVTGQTLFHNAPM